MKKIHWAVITIFGLTLLSVVKLWDRKNIISTYEGKVEKKKTPIQDTSTANALDTLPLDGSNKGGVLIAMKRTEAPVVTELRLQGEDQVRALSATEHSITSGGKVLWDGGQERIGNVQESPDGTMVLFYNFSRSRYQIFRHQAGMLTELGLEIPHRDQTTRVNGWYWLGNRRLVGEHSVLLEPVPIGHEDEGWTKEIKFYLFDLDTKCHHEIQLPRAPEYEKGVKKVIKDEFSPSYSYEIEIARYFSINGITDAGIVSLLSLDTSHPRGGDPRDEGWFEFRDPFLPPPNR